MTCRDCIHREVCDFISITNDITIAKSCYHFKNKADYAEVKHGKWIDLYGNKYDNHLYICSVCGGKALYKFERNELGHEEAVQDLSVGCPHCLAKMDGEKE